MLCWAIILSSDIRDFWLSIGIIQYFRRCDINIRDAYVKATQEGYFEEAQYMKRLNLSCRLFHNLTSTVCLSRRQGTFNCQCVKSSKTYLIRYNLITVFPLVVYDEGIRGSLWCQHVAWLSEPFHLTLQLQMQGFVKLQFFQNLSRLPHKHINL